MIYNSKHKFTAGEISPLMRGQTDFERFKNGCSSMKNMVAVTQGPTARRLGFEFIYDLDSIAPSVPITSVRTVPFVFNSFQTYVMIFLRYSNGAVLVVFATDSGLVVYSDPPQTECPFGTPIAVNAGDILSLAMPEGWDIEAFDYAQSGDVMYIAQSGMKVHSINRQNHTCWTVEEVAFTGEPADWDSVYGWPECVSFFQQRLGFGGNTKERQKVWLSRAGDFQAFDNEGATIVDSDPVSFTLDSESQNQIVWMQASKKLNIGTIGNEWVVSGNNQSAITPSSVLAESHTGQGSKRAKPIRVGNDILFVDFHGRAINEFAFDYSVDSYKTSDISVLAPHLTEEYSISRWTYQRTPSSIVWCVRADGALLGLTYQRQHDVVAWHRHYTQGEFIDVCSIPGDNREDDLWAIVRREKSSGSRFYLEKKAPEVFLSDATEGRFLDSFLHYSGESTNSLSGLDHLEGLTVGVMVDGHAHPDRVVESGSITLNKSATNVLVGLSYDSEVEPLMPEIPLGDGSSVNRKQKTLGILVNLYKSLGFEIGVVYSDGEEIWEEQSFRSPTDPVSTAVPLFTGVKEVDGSEGFDDSARLIFRQRQPFPLTVLSITKKVEVA